jgi:hypothetical protein
MTFKESLKWAWTTKPFRYFVIGFVLLTTWLVIREVNYEKWYGDENTPAPQTEEVLSSTADSTQMTVDTLVTE